MKPDDVFLRVALVGSTKLLFVNFVWLVVSGEKDTHCRQMRGWCAIDAARHMDAGCRIVQYT